MAETPDESGPSLESELRAFGLSETEIDAYLALLRHGEATTSAVADDTDVTQRAVYGIAERLEDRGLVRVNDHASPTTIRAIPPEEAMGNLTERLSALTPLLEERFNETRPETPTVEMVKSRETVLKRVKRAISGAEHEVVLAVPEAVYPAVEEELRDAVERDVLVLLLLSDAGTDPANADRFAGAADLVRAWDERVPLLYTVDDRVAMIGSADVVSKTHNSEDAVEVSRSRLTGTVLSTYLGTYWPAATELYVTEPCPLPRAFDWFRRAALHAALHRIGGTDLWADIETVDGETLAGPVVEVRQTLVDPTTNDVAVATSLRIETEDGEVSVGGPDAFIEDYEAASVSLREAGSR